MKGLTMTRAQRTRVWAAASIAASVVAGPQAVHAHHEPEVRTEHVYFHCNGSNVANMDPNPGHWTTRPPATSMQDGGGGLQVDLGERDVFAKPAVEVTAARFSGTFTGVMRDLTVQLDRQHASAAADGRVSTYTVTLAIDGVPILGEAGRTVTVAPGASARGGYEHAAFSITGLDLLGHEDDRKHQLELTIEAPPTSATAWVYDSTEYDGGIVFNPSEPSDVAISA